ncbi:CHRD domain-containing protein [Massilia sp. RP-1-19]|uniref:CHRD domain-containing protein n=1 Tax=Massilia polaris TaxID=2728846 RepID=A0A848HTC1_9BURK|nr:CHRD domain-containing protein [Massilia polaris]NML62971.1 CHRD domain-containing protein [Massilia polaris]
MKLQSITFIRILPALVVALLAACGGGSDDDYNDFAMNPPPATTPPPTTPPPTTPPPTTPPPTTPPPAYTEQYVATLNAATEVPPNPTAGTGTGTLAVDPATRMMTATVTTTGVPGVAGHIHQGAAGVNGPIQIHLAESATGSGVWSATAQLTDAQLVALRAGNLYFNIHTVVYPDGQIRGQIHP